MNAAPRFVADLVVRLSARLVPRARRSAWLEEWQAEIDHAASVIGGDRSGSARLMRMALGSIRDAFAVRRLPLAPPPYGRQPRVVLRGLSRDLTYALRTLAASPGFGLTIVTSLGLGIAVNTTAFSVVNAAVFRPFPGVTTPQDRLVQVGFRSCSTHGCLPAASTVEHYMALGAVLTGLDGLAARTSAPLAVAIDGTAHSLYGAFVSGNYFDVLGVRLPLGRGFGEEHDRLANAFVAVISESLWRREFNADPAVLGRFVDLPGGSVRIIGVAPKYFSGTAKGDLLGGRPGSGLSGRLEIWLPLPLTDVASSAPGADGEARGERFFQHIGRLRAGETAERVSLQATAIAASVLPAPAGSNRTTAVDVSPVSLFDRREVVPVMAMFLSVPLIVLAIACVNAANLLLARATRRSGEIAIRLALGATRWQIVRQLLIESLVLSLAAAACAMLVSAWLLRVGTSYLQFPMPLDPRVFAYTLLAAVASAVAFALVPALRATSSTGLLPASRIESDAPRSKARRVLVVAQVALSLGLLGTGTQLVSAVRSLGSAAGTAPDKLLLASFDLRHVKMDRPATELFYDRLLARALTVPAVKDVGLARSTALWTWGMGLRSSVVVWRPDDDPRKGGTYLGGYAGGDLFRAAGLRVLEGRSFTPEDAAPRPSVAIVNRPFADKVLGGGGVGQLVRVAPRGTPQANGLDVRIVGVVEATREPTYSPLPVPAIYLPTSLEYEPALTLYINSDAPTHALVAALREAVRQVDPRVPFTDIATLQHLNDRRLRPDTLMTQGVSVLGILALVLATAGLYGVVSYVVALRTREIGVRLALGALPRGVLAMVLRQAMTLAIVGTSIGAAGALVVTRIAQSEFRGARGFDPLVFSGVIAVLLLAMLAGSLVPARRAASVDPLVALRHD